jgi:hypothetical protein
MKKNARKLYVLKNDVWDANDYLNGRNTDPHRTDLYLYATEEEAEEKAMSLDVDNEIYNDCTLCTGEISEDDILYLTGYETIEEFDEAMAEPYSTKARVKNFGEDEKSEVAQAIFENPTDERPVECSNYDFDKSLEGAVLVFWSWERYIGYARKLIEVRRADSSDTEAILTKKDKVYATQCDIILTAEEVAAADNLKEAIRERLEDGSWKWVNTIFITEAVKNL